MARNTLPTIPAAYVSAAIDMPKGETRDKLMGELVPSFYPTFEAAFAEVNGKADQFTLTAHNALTLALSTEQRLEDMGVPKAARTGATVTRSSGGPSANAYRYGAIGTTFTLRRDSKGSWTLTEVARIKVYPKQSPKTVLRVSAAARDAILRNAMAGIEVLPEPAPAPV